MSEKTLQFNNIRLNKKEFHKSKQPIDLMSVNTKHIVTSDKSGIVAMSLNILLITKKMKLYIILPQMSGYKKYFENGGENMSFMVKDDNMLDKYKKIWDKIKEKLDIKFHSIPVYDKTYIKDKVREFDGKIETNILDNEVQKENINYTCIACITIDSVNG